MWGLRSIITPLCDDYPSEAGHMAEDEATFGISSSNSFPGDKRRLGRIRRRTPFCLISRSLWFGGSRRALSTQKRKRDLSRKAPYSRLPFSPCLGPHSNKIWSITTIPSGMQVTWCPPPPQRIRCPVVLHSTYVPTFCVGHSLFCTGPEPLSHG